LLSAQTWFKPRECDTQSLARSLPDAVTAPSVLSPRRGQATRPQGRAWDQLGRLRGCEPAAADRSLILPDQAVVSTQSLSAALALVQSLEPENEAQAALAIQVTCLHAASTNVMSRSSALHGERRIVVLATASRPSRAFDHALETDDRLKRGNTQVIRIEEVEVQPGAQAFVGNLPRSWQERPKQPSSG
jgi:hypothetical protein